MALTETMVQDQVNIDTVLNTISVRTKNSVLKDGVEIAYTYHRKAYEEYDYDAFLAEVQNAQGYITLLGWVPGKVRPAS